LEVPLAVLVNQQLGGAIDVEVRDHSMVPLAKFAAG
jgi:hypothetical protein